MEGKVEDQMEDMEGQKVEILSMEGHRGARRTTDCAFSSNHSNDSYEIRNLHPYLKDAFHAATLHPTQPPPVSSILPRRNLLGSVLVTVPQRTYVIGPFLDPPARDSPERRRQKFSAEGNGRRSGGLPMAELDGLRSAELILDLLFMFWSPH